MNRYTLALFLFFLATLPVAGQQKLFLAERPSSDKVAQAKDLLKSAESAPTKLAIVGYVTIDIKLPGKLKSYIVPGSDDCIRKILIPKGTAYEGWLLDSADGQIKWTRLDPADVDRVLVTGTAKGTATLVWHTVVNGESEIVAAFQFIVAGGGPKPVDPIDPIPDSSDALVIAATADVKAGKGTVDDVDAYSSLFLMYGTQVKNGSSLTTFGELNKEMNSNIDRLLGSDIEKCLPSLRKAVGKELVAKIPTITNANGKIADVRELLSAELLSISKRLQGVK